MTEDTLKRKRAAKKAARTRAANRAAWERWETIDKPSNLRIEAFLNELLKCGNFDVRLAPLGKLPMHLKGGVTKGRIVKFLHGGKTVRVKPDGYRTSQEYHISFWEPIL